MSRSRFWTWTFATTFYALAAVQAVRFYVKHPEG